ncbi:putative Zn-dependent oxidoreductase [Hyaloscypha variabilis]
MRPNAGLTLHGPVADVWGASAAGVVTEIGDGVPSTYQGRKVAIYRSLEATALILGLWCETAQLPFGACLLLPDYVDEKDYSGSLVNIVTAYAFLEQAAAEGHKGVLVTAGNSATGRAISVLARKRGVPLLSIVRSETAKEDLVKSEMESEHVLIRGDSEFSSDLEKKAVELGTTAVFDGVGGGFIGQILGALPVGSSIFFYGFLSGPEPVSFHSSVVMMKQLTLKRFGNFETETVKDQGKKAAMLKYLEGCIEEPLFKTRLGKVFELGDINAALGYQGPGGSKAVLLFSK